MMASCTAVSQQGGVQGGAGHQQCPEGGVNASSCTCALMCDMILVLEHHVEERLYPSWLHIMESIHANWTTTASAGMLLPVFTTCARTCGANHPPAL